MNCQHIFTHGKKQNQKCNVENCTKHKPKTPCTFILSMGINKGNECGKNNCKSHSGLGRYNGYPNIEIPINEIYHELNNCIICLDDFNQNTIVTKTHCNHFFHYKCIEKWCFRHLTCPFCREPISHSRNSSIYFRSIQAIINRLIFWNQKLPNLREYYNN